MFINFIKFSPQKILFQSVYQALILTCSDAVQNQQLSDNQSQDIPNIIDAVADHTYQEMFQFWELIFSDSTLLWVGHQTGEHIEDNNDAAVKEFFTILYDEFFSSVFHMIRALNFKVIDVTTSDQVDGASTNTEDTQNTQELIDSNLIAIAGSSDLSNLQPMVSKDFVIFQNLVDFWQLFLPRVRKELFSRWIYLAGDNLISFSTQYPYVSGFYKMVGSCLKVCESIQYFTGIKNLDSEVNLYVYIYKRLYYIIVLSYLFKCIAGGKCLARSIVDYFHNNAACKLFSLFEIYQGSLCTT